MRYIEPGRLTGLSNALVAALTRMGLSLWGSRILAVRGRKSGEWRSTPVNMLEHDGARYLVAPRGETQWVRNLRVAGSGELRVGRRVEAFTAEEVADADKPDLLRVYLKRWKWEIGAFFKGLDHNSPETDLINAAPGYPVFRIR